MLAKCLFLFFSKISPLCYHILLLLSLAVRHHQSNICCPLLSATTHLHTASSSSRSSRSSTALGHHTHMLRVTLCKWCCTPRTEHVTHRFQVFFVPVSGVTKAMLYDKSNVLQPYLLVPGLQLRVIFLPFFFLTMLYPFPGARYSCSVITSY